MKLKSVVASLIMAGLVSSPAFAATKDKVGHRHRKAGVTNTRHNHVRNAAHEALVYQNNAKSPVSSFDWTNRIHLSGYINVDGRYGTRGPIGIVPVFHTCDESHELNVNNANIFVDAFINHCVTAHVGFAYVADSVNLFDTGLHTADGFKPLTESIRSDKGSVFAGGEVSVDETYITFRDFASSPLYFRAGKMYTPFGVYHNPYPITYSLPQLLSQTRATAAELGFVSNCGLYGNIYLLDGGTSASAFAKTHFQGIDFSHDDRYLGVSEQMENDHNKGHYYPFTCLNNYGATLGYVGCFEHNTTCTKQVSINYHLNAGYVKDIRDVAFLTDLNALLQFQYLGAYTDGENWWRSDIHGPKGYGMKSTGGASIHGDATMCNLHLSFDYVTALRNMIRDPHSKHEYVTGTRIWAADLTGVYNNNCYGYNTAWSCSYQWSRQGGGVLPKWRLQGDVTAEIFRNTSLTFEYTHNCDYDYNSCDGFCDYINYSATGGEKGRDSYPVCAGTGHNYNQASLRLGVVF